MKNIFKFMGIALMATSLLVACNPDKEDEEDPIDTTPVNPNPAPQQGTLEITWNGQAQEIGDIIAKADNTFLQAQSGDAPYTLFIDACKGVDDEGYVIYPEFIAAFAAMGGQVYCGPQLQLTLEDNQGHTQQGTLNDVLATEVFETAGIQVGQGTYGDYQFDGPNAAPMFSAFDATKLTLNGEVNYKFYAFGEYVAALQAFQYTGDTTGMIVNGQLADTAKYEAYLQAVNEYQQNAKANATRKDMVMKINNYIFTAGKI